jgi:putative ABC transport system permease protein
MSWLRFFRRRRSDAELQLEMDTFMAEEIADNTARGMTPEDARRRARIKMGDPQKARETLWEQNTFSALDTGWRDVKYSARTLLRTPGFSLIAVAVMALCIGAATSLFTIVRSVLLRPLPFRDPDKLVMLYEHFRSATANQGGFNYNVVAPADYYDWRAQTHGFEERAVMRRWHFNLSGQSGEMPEVVEAEAGSWNLFPLLGVQPAYGRTFTVAEDSTSGDAVMLTWSLFQRRFGGDASIVGKRIHLDGKPWVVVGVLPAGFTYPDGKIQVWITYRSALAREFLLYHTHHLLRRVATWSA